MPKLNTIVFIAVLTALAGLLGYNYYYQPLKDWQPFAGVMLPSPSPSQTNLPSAEEITDSAVLEVMVDFTPRQKVAQLLAVPVTVANATSSLTGTASWAITNRAGAITLFGAQISTPSAQTLISQFNSSDPWLKPLVGVDHEGGEVQRLTGQGFTVLPSWQSVCGLPAETRQQVLGQSAQELKQVGVDIVLAPMLEVAAAHPVLKSRVCSGDANVVIERSQEFSRIFNDHGVMPVIKHFPGIGQTKRDLHQDFDRVTVTASDAAVFAQVLKQQPQIGVMIAHVGVVNQYPDVPCSISRDCVAEVALSYPKAVIMTDALEMAAARYQVVPPATQSGQVSSLKSLNTVSTEAVLAGNHLLVYGPGVTEADLESVLNTLEQQYLADAVFAKRVDQSLKQVLELKQRHWSL